MSRAAIDAVRARGEILTTAKSIRPWHQWPSAIPAGSIRPDVTTSLSRAGLKLTDALMPANGAAE
jgi:hypothetical protein